MILIVTAICLLLTLCYVLLMVAYSKGWAMQQEFRLPVSYEPTTFISVIVAARNEKDNIGACIESVLAQKYPADLFELIVIDDHSEDGTADVVNGFTDERVRCLELAKILPRDKKINAYKKAALAAGISRSKGTLIVTTDADCVAPNAWLTNLACLYERERPAMIVAPVVFYVSAGLVRIFQLIDFMSMQGITVAAHNLKMGNMSNGANLAFTRAAYDAVSGYEGIDNLASGDDYLLMNKISKLPDAKIAYLKSPQAIITTLPQPDWRSFLQQRIRWASKSGKYDDKKLTSILMLVYLFNVSFVALAFAGLVNHDYWLLAAGMLIVKAVTEYIYMIPISAFFGKQWTRVYFPFLQPLHILYITLAGFLGFIGNYKWKDRKVK